MTTSETSHHDKRHKALLQVTTGPRGEHQGSDRTRTQARPTVTAAFIDRRKGRQTDAFHKRARRRDASKYTPGGAGGGLRQRGEFCQARDAKGSQEAQSAESIESLQSHPGRRRKRFRLLFAYECVGQCADRRPRPTAAATSNIAWTHQGETRHQSTDAAASAVTIRIYISSG